MPEPLPADPIAEVRRWTYVHETTNNPAEDGIWRAIDRRISDGYSGVSGAREMEANADIHRAIEAIRADERARWESRYQEVVAAARAFDSFIQMVDSGMSVFPLDPEHEDPEANVYVRVREGLSAALRALD